MLWLLLWALFCFRADGQCTVFDSTETGEQTFTSNYSTITFYQDENGTLEECIEDNRAYLSLAWLSSVEITLANNENIEHNFINATDVSDFLKVDINCDSAIDIAMEQTESCTVYAGDNKQLSVSSIGEASVEISSDFAKVKYDSDSTATVEQRVDDANYYYLRAADLRDVSVRIHQSDDVIDSFYAEVSDVLNSTEVHFQDTSPLEVVFADAGSSQVYVYHGSDHLKVAALGGSNVTVNDDSSQKIEIDARCAQNLVAFLFHNSEWQKSRRKPIRVFCPEFGDCTVRDEIKVDSSQTQFGTMVVVSSKKQWDADAVTLIGIGNGDTFLFAFWGTFKRNSESFAQCLATDTHFKQKCAIIPGRKIDSDYRYYKTSDTCDDFTLSIWYPFVHLLAAVTTLCLCAALFVLLFSKDFAKSDFFKAFFVHMCLFVVFCLLWIAWAVYIMASNPMGVRTDLRLAETNISDVTVICYVCTVVLWLSSRIVATQLSLSPISAVTLPSFVNCFLSVGTRKWLATGLLVCELPLLIAFFVFGQVFFGRALMVLSLFILLEIVFVFVVSKIVPFGIWLNFACVYVLLKFSDCTSVVYFFAIFCMSFVDLLCLWSVLWLSVRSSADISSTVEILLTAFKNTRALYKAWNQVFDFATDVVVLVFWLSAGYVWWALFELCCVLTPILACGLYAWPQSNWQRVVLLLGLQRATEVFSTVDTRTMNFTNAAETQLESLPSLFFGVFVLLSAEDSATGPVLFSLCITVITVALKSLSVVEELKQPLVVRCAVCLLLVADFFVRCMAPALALAVLQIGTDNDNVTVGAAVFGTLYFASLFAAHWFAFAHLWPHQSGRTGVCQSVAFSLFSCRPSLYSFLRTQYFADETDTISAELFVAFNVPVAAVSVIISVSLLAATQRFVALTATCLLFSLLSVVCTFVVGRLSNVTQTEKVENAATAVQLAAVR